MSEHKFQLVTRGDASVLLCVHCERPFLTIENGEISIDSKHGSTTHTNKLIESHLRMIAIEIWKQQHPPERW